MQNSRRTAGRVLSKDRLGGCTPVMIGRPSPKTFPSLLYIGVRPVDVSAAGKSMAGLRAHAAIPRSSWFNAGSKFPLGREKNRCNSRRMTFGRATPGASVFSGASGFVVLPCSGLGHAGE